MCSIKHPDRPFYCATQNDIAKLGNMLDYQVDIASLGANWKSFLDSSQNEQEAQDFLERNPILIPGLMDFHHGPLGDIVASKLRFGSDYVSDFAFITANSAVARATFVEIEDPNKEIFTSDDKFTQKFRESAQQVADWRGWCESNRDALWNIWGSVINECGYSHTNPSTYFYLIVGRRTMVEASPLRQRRWSDYYKQNIDNFEVMTYDRLFDRFRYASSTLNVTRLVMCTYGESRFLAKSSLL